MTTPDAEGQLPARPDPAPTSAGGTLPTTPVAPASPRSAVTPAPAPPKLEAQSTVVSSALPQSIEERIAAATAAGGLTALPADFGDAQGDWASVRGSDPFTILHLDYRQADRITPEIASRHRELLLRFWQEKIRSMTQGAARFAILKKYGGPEESERLVRSYPELIENAYEQLITRGGIDDAYQRIIAEKETIVCSRIDEKLEDFLVDLVLQPEEVRFLLLFGERENVRGATVAARIHEGLRRKGLVAETEPTGATLEARLLSTAWVHPSKRRTETAIAMPQPVPRKQSPLTPLLLFSLVVVLVLLAGAALRSALSGTSRGSIVVSTTTAAASETTSAISSTTTTVVENSVISAKPADPVPAFEQEAPKPVREQPSAIEVNAAERRRIQDELAAIEQESDPQSAIDRLAELEQTIGEQFVDERIAGARLRSELERTLLLRQVDEEKKAAEARAAAEREREWEQRIAAIEELMKQPNYSGAKTLADQLLSSPDIPPAIAARGKQLRDEAVVELQKIFSAATIKSRTGRAPRRPQ